MTSVTDFPKNDYLCDSFQVKSNFSGLQSLLIHGKKIIKQPPKLYKDIWHYGLNVRFATTK